MDQMELRLAVLETAFIEVMGLIDPASLADAAQSLRERADTGCSDERSTRLDAAQLLEDAVRRWDPPFRARPARPA